jgi:lysophospholipase L1-like esterase
MLSLIDRRLRVSATLLAVLAVFALPCVPSFRLAAQATAAVATPRTAVANQNEQDRWEPAIKKFEDADKVTPPPQNAIVFIGASSIVRWNLPESFPELGTRAINRGFGGSLAADSTRYADRIVIPYKPRIVVFYAGDNDVEANHTPEQIAGDFAAFERKVHAALPATQIIFISIKPSIRRWPWIEQIKGANALVRQYCATHPHLAFVDIVPQMIGADGKPRKELLVEDGLHMTPAGYKIWNAALRPLLQLSQSSQ